MKFVKKSISLYISICVTILCILNIPIYASAKTHVSGDNVVYKESVTMDSGNSNIQYGWTPSGGVYCYKIDDSAGISAGSQINGMCFFKYGDDDKFGAIPSSQFITLIVNKGLGLVLSDTKMQAFYLAYLNNIGQTANAKAGSLVDSQGNVLGYCLNDISGCTYDAYPANTSVDIPSQEVNNVYNFYQYYIDTVAPETPDYITVQTYNLQSAYSQLDVTDSYYNSDTAIYNAIGESLCTSFYKNGNIAQFKYNTSNYNRGLNYYDITGRTCYASAGYDSVCSTYGLRQNGDEIGYTALIGTGDATLYIYTRDDTSGSTTLPYTKYSTQAGNSFTTETGNSTSIKLFSRNYIPCSKNAFAMTVYKDSTIVTQVVNNTYAPTSYKSTKYTNYDTNTDNSISTNTTNVNNATTTNTNIYNESTENFQEYMEDNSTTNIDNSVVNTNTTTIINNYYGDNNSGGDDNGGGSGGSGGSGDGGLTDDSILGALLQAILAFFDAIGQIIMTILTGIVTVITDVLTAIGNITTNLTGITDFFTQIFSFIPEEIMSVLVLGITISVLVALIKLIRG